MTRALECKRALQHRLEGATETAEREILGRVLQFPFEDYPDTAVPWHLLEHERMRWDHVHDVIYLIENLRQPTGSSVGARLTLQPFQVMIILAFLGPESEDGLRVVKEGLLTLARKSGKLLRVDEPIPTPSGWVRNGDLKAGDEVFGVDGLPCRIVHAFPVETPERAYLLTFSDGSQIEAGAEHQWLTRHKWRPWNPPATYPNGTPRGGSGHNRRPVEMVVTTQQIAESLRIPRPDGGTEYNHSVELCAPVQYPERDLPLDPYTLGVWLAEGHSSSSDVTLHTDDAEHILPRVSLGHYLKCDEGDSYCETYKLGERNELRAIQRQLGIFGQKRIPEDYRLASVTQRRALLQGILDGDGSATRGKTGSGVEINVKRKDFAYDLVELIRSLGFKPTINLRDGKIDGIVVGQYHEILFTAYREDGVFSLPRKNAVLKPRPSKATRASRRQIIACEYVEPTPMRCIAVDGPDNLYLAGRDYIVTHNTALVAGITTALMILHPDHHGLKGQEIQVGAADREQAGITHQMIERMVQMDDRLGISERFRSTPSRKTVQHLRTLTTLRCLSSDAHRHHGGNPAVVLLDELGNVSNAAAEEFYSVLTTGFGAQKEPLTLMFSTQAAMDQHFFSLQVDRAERINEGREEPGSFAGFVFTLPETDAAGNDTDPHDEKLWHLANPGIDTITSRDDIREWSKKARALPDLENKYRLLRMNQRVSATSAFVSRTVWEANTHADAFDDADLLGRPCTIGIDLSETTDLTALVAVFEPLEPDGPMPVLPYFWIPGDGILERAHRDKVPYDVWARQGVIDTMSSKVVDYGRIADRIIQMFSDYDVRAIGFDRWRWKYLRQALKEKGYEWDDDEAKSFLISIGQGFKDSPRTLDLLEQALLERKLAHRGHPILNWNASNMVVIRDAAMNRKPEKSKSYGRIDGMVALGIALHARDELGIVATGPSVYESADVAMIL